MMDDIDLASAPTTPQRGDNPEKPTPEVIKQDDVILNNPPGDIIVNEKLKGEENFNDPGTTAASEPERLPTPPPLRPTGKTGDDKSYAEKLISSTLELEITQKLFKTYDGVAEKFGAPNVERIGHDIMEVHEQWKEDGIVAATKTATTKYIDHTKTVTKHTFEKTKQATNDSWQKVAETTTNLTNKGLETAKPYLDRVTANPQVDRVVGSVRSASVGAGSMVTTIAASVTEQTKSNLDTAQKKFDHLRGYTPEYAAKVANEEEAWRQVLKHGSGGEELHVPAREELTTSHFVKQGSVLTWRFRVQSHDIGFAVRLRVQGDGGSTEVDVFANQRYESGVTVQGEWSPSTDSALIIVWDNSYSYLREKVVAFQSGVKTLEEHIASQHAEDAAKKQKEQEEKAKKAAGEASTSVTDNVASTSSDELSGQAQVQPTEDDVEETLEFNQVEEESKPQEEVDHTTTNVTTNVDQVQTDAESSNDIVEPAVVLEEKPKDADY